MRSIFSGPSLSHSVYEEQVIPSKHYKYRGDFLYVASTTFILTTEHLNKTIYVSLVNNSVNLILPDINLCTGGEITIQVDTTHPTRTLTISPNSGNQSIFAHNQSGYVNSSGNFVTTNPTVGSRYDLYCNGKNWVNSHIDSKQENITIDATGLTSITLDNKHVNMTTVLTYTSPSAINQVVTLPDPTTINNSKFRVITKSGINSLGVNSIRFNTALFTGVITTSLNGYIASRHRISLMMGNFNFFCGTNNDSFDLLFESIEGIYYISGTVLSLGATIQVPSIPEINSSPTIASNYMPLAGGTFSGDVSFDNSKHMINLLDGSTSSDAATVSNLNPYILSDTASALYVRLSGNNTMTGAIEMNNADIKAGGTGTGYISFSGPITDFRYGNFQVYNVGTGHIYLYNFLLAGTKASDYTLRNSTTGSGNTYLNGENELDFCTNGNKKLYIVNSDVKVETGITVYTNDILTNNTSTQTIGYSVGPVRYSEIWVNKVVATDFIFGVPASGTSTSVYLAQVSNWNLTDFALRQDLISTNTKTFFNSKSSQTVAIAVNNTVVTETQITVESPLQGAFYPNPHNTKTLGSSSNRWLTVYAFNGTIDTSDRNLKRNIEPLSKKKSEIKSFISKLIPITYEWKSSQIQSQLRRKKYSGFSAQETEKCCLDSNFSQNDIVVKELLENGKEIFGMRYYEFIPPLIIYIQSLSEEITLLEKRVTRLMSSTPS